MRVGYIAAHAHSRDGWGRYAAEVALAARARGIQAVLVTAQADADPRLQGLERHVLLPGLPLTAFDTLRSLLAARRLRAVLATCDAVHCVVEPYLPLVALSLPPHTPLVLTAHGSWAVHPLQSRRQRVFFRPALRRVDLLVSQSRFTRDQMARWTDLPPHTVEPAGVDVEAFRRHGRAGLPPWARGGPLVLSVGAIKPRKGHAIALQAVRLVQSEFPDLHHVIVGGGAPGGEAGRLQARAQALGLGERFHLLEDQVHEELLAWYHRADVFLLLPVNVGGSFEGLGLAYLEAAAAGTPCIATRACGAAEAVADGETGLLVPQHDAQAAADALARLLRSKTLRARLGQAGRRRAGQFTWAHLAERLETEYARLAAGRRRGAA